MTSMIADRIEDAYAAKAALDAFRWRKTNAGKPKASPEPKAGPKFRHYLLRALESEDDSRAYDHLSAVASMEAKLAIHNV